MLSQTIDEILPLLELIQQPAFCIREDHTVRSNRAAQHLAPAHGDDLIRWLGDSAQAFVIWDRSTSLEIPISITGQSYSVTLQTLPDGLLCVMHALSHESSRILAVAGQVLRHPLTDLLALVKSLDHLTDDPALLDKAAAMQRQAYRITRIASNLNDFELLQSNQYPLQIQRLDGSALLHAFQTEVEGLALESGHPTAWNIPTKAASLLCDEALLRRALLNLLSNAWKFSPAGSQVSFDAYVSPQWLTVRVKNQCDEESAVILRGAFDRLQQRDLLPNPKWGVGFGLPLTQLIARIHGGMVALEYQDGIVTVTLTVSRRRSTELTTLAQPPFHYDGCLGQVQLELSDCLPNRVYHPDAL